MAWKTSTTESLAIPLVRIRSATADDLSENSPSRSPRITGDSTPRTLSFDERTEKVNAKLFLGDKLSQEELFFKKALKSTIKKINSYLKQEKSNEYSNFLHQIEKYYTHIINTSTEELYSKIGEIVSELHLFNQQWKKTWPGKSFATKVLLQSCRLSRLSQLNASNPINEFIKLFYSNINKLLTTLKRIGINRSIIKCR